MDQQPEPIQNRIEATGGSRIEYRTSRGVTSAQDDLVLGLKLWRLWATLGWNDILQRYRRSILGPFWLTVSMGIFVVALGVLYAELFRQSIDEFLPYFCVGMLVWTLLASYLTESGVLFTSAETYIKQIRLPYSVYVFRASWSKLIIFAHNFVIYLGVLLYFRMWPGAVALLAFVGVLVIALNGTLASLAIGMAAARFRDIPQIINSGVQLAFFVTPVFWNPAALKGHAFVVFYNPFFHLLQIVRAPLLGELPTQANWLAVGLITVVNVVCCGYLFTRFRQRIAYWI